MPQGGDRTASEKFEFDLMLSSIADLYLTTRILLIVDVTYLTRFWTTLEAWCSMQTCAPAGLRPAMDNEKRYEITFILNAKGVLTNETIENAVWKKSPQEMVTMLGSTDVAVTNAKDKAQQLPKIQGTDEHVREVFKKVKSRQALPLKIVHRLGKWKRRAKMNTSAKVAPMPSEAN